MIKRQEKLEITTKYFVIQSISSGVFITRVLVISLISSFSTNLAITMLAIKIARAPLQEWFIKIVKGVSYFVGTILMSWQKLAPLFLMLYFTKKCLFLFILLSLVTGRVMQLNKIAYKEILSYSSVSNLGWILIIIFINIKMFIIATVLY